MPPKTKKSAQPPKKKPYVVPVIKKPKIWVIIAPGLAMLRYRPEMKEPKGSAKARRIKGVSACIVAPVYAAVESFAHWSTAIVEQIFEVGNELHRLTQQQLKLRANSSFPVQCVCPTFCLNYNKVAILVRPCPIPSPLQGCITTALDDAHIRTMEKLLSENHGVVIQCAGKTFSLWKDKSAFHAFIPEGFGSVDNNMPVLLKSKNLRVLLQSSLQLEQGLCDLYSIKVLNKSEIPMTLDPTTAEFKLPSPRDSGMGDAPIGSAPVDETPTATTDAPAEPKMTRKDKKKTEVEEVDEGPSEDVILTYSADYKEIPGNREILVGKEFCKDPDRILHTIIAASLFLYHFPANLWTSAIIRDIMKLGKKIFYESESEDLLENQDWIERIKFPIKFMRKNFSASFDKLVFGRVCTIDREVLNVEQGLMSFFKSNDTGILVGPQIVLVWQQKSNYFMFDPKERDGLGRKWTRLFSSELESTLAGSACVTAFRHPKKLAEVYIDSIALKHRKDPYRIVKIRLFETSIKLEDEGNWIGMSTNKWILVGTKTLCDYSYAEDANRVGKAICIGVSALIQATEKPESDWDSTTIDGALSIGLEVFKQSLPPPSSGNKNFTLLTIKRLTDVGSRRMRLTVVDCMIHGPMLGESKGPGSTVLQKGLNDFFDVTRYGLFTVKDIALALWRGSDNFYYLFYPYEKLFGMPPQCLCTNDGNFPPMGLANTMRFKSISHMYSFISTSLNTKESDEYCLNPCDIALTEAADRPPLQEFEEFGIRAAILRPFKDLHEGHAVYGVRADKQTLANLLTALGFNRINSSVTWNKEDLADILNIGDKIFCKLFLGLPECQARDYHMQWDDIEAVIGMNKFSFTRDPIEGVLETIPEALGEEEEEMFSDEEEYENEEGVEAQDDELFVRPQGPILSKSKDLKGIVSNWDKKKSDFHEAVVETDFYKIAIWKRDDLFFVFDPKASGEVGELTERRLEIGKDHASGDSLSLANGDDLKPKEAAFFIEKRNYTQFNNDGTAYTAWFADFDEFLEHIASKTPQEYKYGKFTLHNLVLSSKPVGTEDFDLQLKAGFRAVAPNHSIIRGSITQNHPSLVNRGKQEFSNCMVAIAFSKITQSQKMSTILLDVVLKYGDRLYSKSSTALKKADKDKYCEIDKLTLDEMAPVFSIYKIKFNWRQGNPVKGNLNVNELKRSTGKLGTIENGAAMILSHKEYLMTFWRSEGNFYLYDPFETNPLGMLAENGLPSMSKFAKLDNLLTYLLMKFVCVGGPNTFTMYPIVIKSLPVEELRCEANDADENEDKSRLISNIPKDQEMFKPFELSMRILRSPLIPFVKYQQSLAVAAVVHSRLQFVELWNYNVSTRINFLSRNLLQKTDCQLNQPTGPPSFEDIRRSFVIDKDILCHIVLTKTMQGPIYTSKRTEIIGNNLKNALTMFFRNCQHVIIYLPGFGTAFALWKENGKFYMFGIDSVLQEIFVIASPNLANLFDTLLKGTDTDCEVKNWYELRSIVVTTVPIKEGICKPMKMVKKTGDGPLSTIDADYLSAESAKAQYFNHISEQPEGFLVQSQPIESVSVSEDATVLYSRDILRAHRFYGTKDFFSSLQASCVEASALSRVKAPSLWKKKTLEKLLTAGVSLYINTVAVKGTSNIQIVDFKGILFMSNFKLEVCPLTPTVQAANKDELMVCLTWVLRKYQTAYLYTDNFCFTLILEYNGCFLYYPGSRGILCKNLRHNCSCLIRFCSISALLDRLLSNGELSLCDHVCIGPICVIKK